MRALHLLAVGLALSSSVLAWADGDKVVWCSYDVGIEASGVSGNCSCITAAEMSDRVSGVEEGGLLRVVKENGDDGKLLHVQFVGPLPTAIQNYYRGKATCKTARMTEIQQIAGKAAEESAETRKKAKEAQKQYE